MTTDVLVGATVAGQILGVDSRTVSNYVREGKLPARLDPVTGRRKFDIDTLKRFRRSGKAV